MPSFPPQHTSGQAAAADEFYAPLLPSIVELHQQGQSLRQIAAELNRRKVPTRNLFSWNAAQIGRVLDRAGVPRTKRRRPRKRSAARTVQAVAGAPAASAVAQAASPRQQQPARPSVPAAPVGRSTAAVATGIHLRLGGQEKGPFDEARVRAMLKAGAVGPGTLGRRDGSGEWVPLGKLLG